MRSWFRSLSLAILVLTALAVTARAQDMSVSGVLIDGEDWELVGEGYQFTQGPAVDAAGQVFFTDVRASQIYKVDLEGKVSVFVDNSAGTGGLMFGADGRLYGCRSRERQIVAYKPDGTFDVIASEIDSNDLAVTREGGVYVTDPRGRRLWYITPQGEKRVAADGLNPNGVILWADEGTLVVTERNEPHLWTFRVEKDGTRTLKFKDRYYGPLRLAPYSQRPGSDGMTVDTAGRLYVATFAGLQVFDPTGRMAGVILKPTTNYLSNVCFGGPEKNYLYATCSDKVFRRKTQATGVTNFDVKK